MWITWLRTLNRIPPLRTLNRIPAAQNPKGGFPRARTLNRIPHDTVLPTVQYQRRCAISEARALDVIEKKRKEKKRKKKKEKAYNIVWGRESKVCLLLSYRVCWSLPVCSLRHCY